MNKIINTSFSHGTIFIYFWMRGECFNEEQVKSTEKYKKHLCSVPGSQYSLAL